MADIVSKDVRSKMMSGIRGKDTKPELMVRKGLHRMGLRYALHRRDLPGKPDLVFVKHRAVVFVHGCFWHKHDCHLFKMPSTRVEFWKVKLEKNVATDTRSNEALRRAGWRVAVVWECALKGKYKKDIRSVVDKCHSWILSKKEYLEIKGFS